MLLTRGFLAAVRLSCSFYLMANKDEYSQPWRATRAHSIFVVPCHLAGQSEKCVAAYRKFFGRRYTFKLLPATLHRGKESLWSEVNKRWLWLRAEQLCTHSVQSYAETSKNTKSSERFTVEKRNEMSIILLNKRNTEHSGVIRRKRTKRNKNSHGSDRDSNPCH